MSYPGSRTRQESGTWSGRGTRKNGSSPTRNYRKFACWRHKLPSPRTEKLTFLRPPLRSTPNPGSFPPTSRNFLKGSSLGHQFPECPTRLPIDPAQFLENTTAQNTLRADGPPKFGDDAALAAFAAVSWLT